MKAAAPLLFLAGIALAPPAAGQEPTPSPPPERLFQDELDLQANANFVQGSGARAFGMGGAFLARADDATAASWNPAGLSYLRLPEVSFVYVRTDFDTRRRDSSGVETFRDDRSGTFPDFLAVAWPYEAGEALAGSLQFSFQRVVPFSSDRTITEHSPGDSTVAVSSVITRGGFDILSLGSGARLSRHLRVGFTVNRWFNGYRQTFAKPARRFPSRQNADFDLRGWNVHLGAIVSPWDNLNVGVVFKTAFEAKMGLARSRLDIFPPQTTNAHARRDLELVLPRAYGVGASWRPRSNLTLSLDYTRSDWSSGRIRNFFTLQRTPLDDVENPPVPTGESGDFYWILPYPTLDDPQQQDTEQIRAGVEYVVIKNRLKWPVRVGYFSDGQFFRSLDGSAPTFDGYTAGTGLIIGRVLLDVAYVYSTGRYTDRASLHNDVKSHRLYASVIYRHPRRRP